MEKEFIPYELAKVLEELGFDEVCYARWEPPTKKGSEWKLINTGAVLDNKWCKNSNYHPNTLGWDGCYAPLYQQAFDWFRKEHGLHSFIDIYPTDEEPNRCWYMIRYMNRGGGEEDYMSGWYSNNEDVELGRLRELIEMVKEK